MPMQTQGAPEHDVVWVVDSDDDFGDYLMYPHRRAAPRGRHARPARRRLASRPTSNMPARILQNRFQRIAKRIMTERDYTAWLAVRAIGESAMRSGKTACQELRAYLLSDEFERRRPSRARG